MFIEIIVFLAFAVVIGAAVVKMSIGLQNWL
jgi:hypothetical protein